MKRTQARMLRQRREVGLLRVATIEVTDDAGDSFVIVHGNIFTRNGRRSHPILALF